MPFHSILSEKIDEVIESSDPREYFVDLNLDQIIESITASKKEYNLKPFFFTPLTDVDSIFYRHEIFRDLENPELFKAIIKFAQNLRTMREFITQANKLYYLYQKETWFVDAVTIYCKAVNDLVQDINLADLKSRGLINFRDFLTAYSLSDQFTQLLLEAQQIIAELSTVKYSMIIKGSTIKVRHYESEPDYSAEVEQTFDKFKQGAVKDYRVKLSEWIEMNHVEAKVLDFVALLYPDIFAKLNDYCVKNQNFLNETVGIFDREIQFYIAYLEHIETFKNKGLQFCYPQISNPEKDIFDYDGFDLALADKLKFESSSVICNDFYLKGKERIIVVSGPNQGGKTTFARTFGQLHYLTSLGCPVPGREARLLLVDQLFTHFEQKENIKNLRGKLQDDLVRITEILDKATPNSIVILNEIFTSTTLSDAIFLSKKVMDKIIELDLLCVCVTFIDEMSHYSEKTISMVSTVALDNPTLRTFKIIRKSADGLSYALSIAEKYRLTYNNLKERLKS